MRRHGGRPEAVRPGPGRAQLDTKGAEIASWTVSITHGSAATQARPEWDFGQWDSPVWYRGASDRLPRDDTDFKASPRPASLEGGTVPQPYWELTIHSDAKSVVDFA